MKWLITLVIGVVLGAVAVIYGINRIPLDPPPAPAASPVPAPAVPAAPAAVAEPAAASAPAGVVLPADALPGVTVPPIAPVPVTSGVEPMPAEADGLAMPVAGVLSSQLTDTFGQARGSERQHEALDIMAARGTEVKAVADGKLVKLFTSKPGGLTVYQFDPREKYSYYYAHLDRYAPDLKEGQQLKRGDVIGYVGSTGNADPAAPHLHFAIFELNAEKQWWKGTPINPYPVLRGEQKLP